MTTATDLHPGGRDAAGLLTACAITLGALVVLRSRLPASPTTGRGDEIALCALWIATAVYASWSTLALVVCLAVSGCGRHARARRMARWAPPVARRILEAALLSTWALAPSTASAAPTGPLILHADPHGHLVHPSPGAHAHDVPVVRRRASSPEATARPATARPAPARRDVRVHVVRAGDNLWAIARSEVATANGRADPDDGATARYWLRLIDANRATLRSGDPSLIFPGELVALPRV